MYRNALSASPIRSRPMSEPYARAAVRRVDAVLTHRARQSSTCGEGFAAYAASSAQAASHDSYCRWERLHSSRNSASISLKSKAAMRPIA